MAYPRNEGDEEPMTNGKEIANVYKNHSLVQNDGTLTWQNSLPLIKIIKNYATALKLVWESMDGLIAHENEVVNQDLDITEDKQQRNAMEENDMRDTTDDEQRPTIMNMESSNPGEAQTHLYQNNTPNFNYDEFLKRYGDIISKDVTNRRSFNTHQLKSLEEQYKRNNYPSTTEFDTIASELRLPKKKIVKFFQNCRARKKLISKDQLQFQPL